MPRESLHRNLVAGWVSKRGGGSCEDPGSATRTPRRFAGAVSNPCRAPASDAWRVPGHSERPLSRRYRGEHTRRTIFHVGLTLRVKPHPDQSQKPQGPPAHGVSHVDEGSVSPDDCLSPAVPPRPSLFGPPSPRGGYRQRGRCPPSELAAAPPPAGVPGMPRLLRSPPAHASARRGSSLPTMHPTDFPELGSRLWSLAISPEADAYRPAAWPLLTREPGSGRPWPSSHAWQTVCWIGIDAAELRRTPPPPFPDGHLMAWGCPATGTFATGTTR